MTTVDTATLEEGTKRSLNFIEQMVESDLKEGKNNGSIATRFPPEPNGYLHIGHAKAICLDFGIAQRYGGTCNLRFDDTNPVKEDVEYVDSIKEDIQWLGFQWDNLYYASDYFDQLYEFAKRLIRNGLAYVDDQSAEQIAAQKGTPTSPGTESPYRNRSVEENLDLFERMQAGAFEEGSRVLRAKIDMAHSNMHFRDPLMYRILKMHHHRTGDKWNIYPLYDFAHGQSDYIEGITHSLCTLEFEVHRPLYDWFLNHLAEAEAIRPRQIEFNRLNITYMVMSKRKMLQLVKEGRVSSWDDPRMPTLCGLRRRGYTPLSIRNFVDKIGYTKFDGIIDIGLLEHSIREHLNKIAPRVSAVLDPIRLVVENFPEGEVEWSQTEINPEDKALGTRPVPFTRELYIDRCDFMEDAPKDYFRLTPGREVRLKNAYIVQCTGSKKNDAGEVEEVYCEYIPETKSGQAEAKRKVKGTINYVSVPHSLDVEVRLYERLLSVANPAEEKNTDFMDLLNPDSLKVLPHVKIEPVVQEANALDAFQFMRVGYFCVDPDSTPDRLIFNRTVSLKDTWGKLVDKQKKG
ncbi:MAG: glutamine--tRNA ligase/YqeY domain fusion protein [Bacteroidales bacterium]|nr:glutamine--tRNA ligase/YqeY domain fusion protein [Bacteroidales bacterium]MDD4771836.1 glutamine--tRNA ligase/YqeY domain fusion protein [Bacteroidales bacterium]